MKFKDGNIFLDIHELSRELETKVNTIRVWVKRGQVDDVKMDGRFYYNISQFPQIDRVKIISEIIQNISKNI